MKHPDWEGFVAAIVANPDDDTLRLVAADFLEENGEPDRAAFIRIQIELARLEASGLGKSLEADEMRKNERAFLGPFSVFPHLRAAEECPELVRVVPPTRTSSPLTELRVEGVDRLTWRRGFIDAVRCQASDWLRHGVEVRKRNPVRVVGLFDPQHVTRDAWYAGLGSLRGLRAVDLFYAVQSPVYAPIPAEELAAWLRKWLPGTRVELEIPF